MMRSNRKCLRVGEFRFSLRHLLTLTALIAVGLAIGIALRKNQSLRNAREDLSALSSRINAKDRDQVTVVAMPQIASGFYSWNIHIPKSTEYELRLGVGTVSADGVPPVVGKLSIASGEHRVTLYTGDSPEEEFRFAVFVDGELAIEKEMGKDWLPRGWSSASSISWPHDGKRNDSTVQLAGKRYEEKRDFGRNHYFHGRSDELVSRLGFRLWFDLPRADHPLASPFVGAVETTQLFGIGLRDGMRFRPNTYPWEFTRPQLETLQPLARLEFEFVEMDQEGLANRSYSFSTWKVRSNLGVSASNSNAIALNDSTRSISLQAEAKTLGGPQPVLELKWDRSEFDYVSIRVADSPSNDFIDRWRLRVVDGGHHLWRAIRIGDDAPLSSAEAFGAGEIITDGESKFSRRRTKLKQPEKSSQFTTLGWKTDKTSPLQIVERSDGRYAGLELYQGVPISFSMQIPTSLMPTFAIEVADQLPGEFETRFPEAPVIEALEMEVNRGAGEWIRLGIHEANKP